MTQKNQLKITNYAAILSIFLFSGAGSFMNAAVQTMMDAWPELSATTVRLVTSLPSLISLPITIFIGSIAGKKLSYRFCAILGTALIAIAGVAPFFLHSNWMMILFFRALVGIGVGFVAMRNSLIIKSVPEENQAAIIGYGSALMNAGGTLAGPIVGFLAGFGWKVPFLFDMLAIIPVLMMVFFLKEPEKTEVDKASAHTDTSQNSPKKTGNNWRVYYYIIMQFVATAALYPLLSGMSTYMADKQIGSAFLAGINNSVYCLAGVLINLVLSQLLKALRQYTLPVMCLIFSVGMGILVFFPTVPAIMTGAVLMGITFNTMMSVFQLYNGKTATAATVTLTSTLLIAALSLGNFMSVYFINLCHAIFHRSSDIESTYFGSMILYLIMGILAFVLKIAPEEK
ncbi:MFS transporter [Blautia sp. HCP3S3_G3]|uniref:MFS transporter n=1 Tax=Blautia sp. HCP3S3_G3 TaxID=3438913 RepID=UPI003F8B7555